MRLEPPDLLGLALGFAVGGVALAAYVVLGRSPAPEPVVATTPPAQSAQAAPRPAPPSLPLPRPEATVAAPPRVHHPGQAVPMPPSMPAIDGVPNVVRPSDRSRPGTISGTGFFVSRDGAILTAAHVVEGCRATKIVSADLRPADARLVATDDRHDLALLRTQAPPPAVLGLSTARTGGRDLLVYGYPAQGDALVPTEALARAKSVPAEEAARIGIAGAPMWLDASDVRQGFSGGPMVTADGEAVGLIQAVVARPSASRDVAPSPSGVALGPDSRTIAAFLRREAPELEIGGDWKSQAGDTVAARKAVVHVYCLR